MSWKKGSHETPTSAGPRPSALAIAVAEPSAARCEMTAPRGSPVDPEVNCMKAGASSGVGEGRPSVARGAVTSGVPQSMVAVAGVVHSTSSRARCNTGRSDSINRSGAPSTTGQGRGTATAPSAWAAKKAPTKSGLLGNSTPTRLPVVIGAAWRIAAAQPSARAATSARLMTVRTVPVWNTSQGGLVSPSRKASHSVAASPMGMRGPLSHASAFAPSSRRGASGSELRGSDMTSLAGGEDPISTARGSTALIKVTSLRFPN